MGLSQRLEAFLRAAGRDSNADLHYSFLLSYALADASAARTMRSHGGPPQALRPVIDAWLAAQEGDDPPVGAPALDVAS